jgi:hypothetical protein
MQSQFVGKRLKKRVTQPRRGNIYLCKTNLANGEQSCQSFRVFCKMNPNYCRCMWPVLAYAYPPISILVVGGKKSLLMDRATSKNCRLSYFKHPIQGFKLCIVEQESDAGWINTRLFLYHFEVTSSVTQIGTEGCTASNCRWRRATQKLASPEAK